MRPGSLLRRTATILAGLLVAATLQAVTTPTSPAAAAACDTACKLFTDTAALTQQRPAPFASPINGHAETSSIIWNNQYLMYYRTFISPSGASCTIPQGIAYATSSDQGRSWIPANGGRPIPALQTVQERQSCTFDDSVRSTWVYAPDVIADGSRLVMAFEQRDRDPNYFGPGSGRSLHSVRYVTSADGRNWSGSTRLLAPAAVGAWDDEVGTPDIEKDGSAYVITFHGHDSRNILKQRRATVRMNSLTENYSGPRNQFQLSTTPSWANYGLGVGDMTREPDGYWYLIFEAFSGASGACGRRDTRTAVGIARSTNAVNWTVRAAPLLYGRNDTSCGWDMPAWQNIGAVRSIVTPDDPPEAAALARWNIVDKSVPVVVNSGTTLRQNQYLPVGGTLTAPGNTARLVMQSDGNLVLYRNSDGLVLWASDTDHSGAVRAYMQYDGNLVLQRADNAVVRATATDGRPGATFNVTANGVYIDAYGTNIWQLFSARCLSTGRATRLSTTCSGWR